ncbi:TerC family protein [Pelagibius marinus]|uniref:TerC family protein n=1 Tax=Pelagibius marinus TaxID=2762760 RepID=UPI0018729A7D|nr:TerC family protein [Pelagibius marinus]
MPEWLADPNIWASLLTLTFLEIVLGIDNIIFLSIITERVAEHRRLLAQRLGLALALFGRVGLLAGLVWLTKLTTPIFEVFDLVVSWRDIILMGGGLFLLAKATSEIHHSVEGGAGEAAGGGKATSFAMAIAQILAIDLVFSLDSVITAVGMTDRLPIMVAAVVTAIAVMMFAATPISGFIRRHPTTKMLALAFLLLIGVALVADALHFHVPRGYLYFAIAFSLMVELLNLAASKRRGKAEEGAD